MNKIKALPVRTYRVRYMFEDQLTSCTENEEDAKENVLNRLMNHMPAIEKLLGMTIIKEDFILDAAHKETLEKNYHRYNVFFELEAEETIDGTSEEEVTAKANQKVKQVIDKIDKLLGTTFRENTTYVKVVTSLS